MKFEYFIDNIKGFKSDNQILLNFHFTSNLNG